ncbi:sialic acid-binding Ig-like lectin 13 isoform X4 [Heptranchias perlo]|uniref:sialic acid-binding Ig-like lectin 13 isoform X4 n=1 Tax=Heptranchias perlo TaxID=212740 RepID=UPI0035593EF2
MDIHPFLSDQSQHNARFPDRMSSVTAQDQEKSPASSKGEWKVTAPQNITTVRGSCVTIPCSFKYPRDLTPDKMVKIWFKSHDSWPNVVSHSTDPEAAMAEFRHRARFLDELGQTNCTLRVWNVSKADESCYLFRVEVANKAKSKFTYKNFPVCIHVFDSPDNPVLSDPGEIIEGIPSRLRCTVYSNCSPWPPEIRWSGLGGLIPTTQSASEHWQYSSVVTIVPSYQDHGKRIHCRVDNVDLKTSSEKIVRLRVRYSPKNTSVIISGKEGAMKEGDNISLTCFTDSNPKPHNYTWFKVHGNETINLNQFTKNVMLARDNWTYYCKAINSVGFGTSPSTTISISELSNDKHGLSWTLILIVCVVCLVVIAMVTIVAVKFCCSRDKYFGQTRPAVVTLEPRNEATPRSRNEYIGDRSDIYANVTDNSEFSFIHTSFEPKAAGRRFHSSGSETARAHGNRGRRETEATGRPDCFSQNVYANYRNGEDNQRRDV